MKRYRALRRLFAYELAIVTLLLLGCSLFGQEQGSDWDALEMATRTYFNYPSTENARLLYLGLRKPLRPDVDRFDRLFDFVLDNLSVLARQIFAGDRNAVKLGFALYDYSSGLFTMEIDAMMADSIRFNPKIFLEELKAAPNGKRIKELGFPLCESRLNSSDNREEAHRYELEMRIKALETVTNAELLDLRDRCLREIRECLERQNQDFPGTLLTEKEYTTLFKKAVVNVYKEAEMANLVCQRIVEIEETSGPGSFGETSQRAVRESGLIDELTALSDKSFDMGEALQNPPLAYMGKYDALRRMIGRAIQLFRAATDPAVVCPSRTSDDVKKSIYKKAIAEYFGGFRDAYRELVTLMPEIDNEVNKNRIDTEAIKRSLSQKK